MSSQADGERLCALLAQPGSARTARAVRVVVLHTQGSAPRDAGTWMAVIDGHGEPIGTIGGGHLEFDAITHARALLAGTADELRRRYPLGPALGQCCGGVVHLGFELHDAHTLHALRASLRAEEADHLPVALFGGGHVGRALVLALSPLPMALQWIDSREGVFPDAAALGLSHWPGSVTTEHAEPVHDAVRDLPPGSHVLIMSFSHAEDLDIVVACLQRRRLHDDLAFIGLIGSKSKWATFRHRLEARGFTPAEIASVVCPIGLPGLAGKAPEVIAASVAAQLLSLPADDVIARE